jgi:hypothetical protein
VRRADVLAASDDGRLDALATMVGNAFDTQSRNMVEAERRWLRESQEPDSERDSQEPTTAAAGQIR